MAALGPKALIADPFVPTSGALRRFLESIGFEVTVVHFLDEAVQRIKSSEPALLVAAVSSTFDGETLCLKAKELAPLLPVILVYPPDEDASDEHARNAGADGFLVGPLKRGTVVCVARLMMKLTNLAAQIRKLESDNDKLIAARLQRAPPPAPAAPVAAPLPAPVPAPVVAAVSAQDRDFEFFKRFLLMEVKRSRRYRYPVAFMLVELDGWAARASAMSAAAKTHALAEFLNAVSSGLRDIDLAMPSSQDRALVFLPHTPREGALIVAERLRARVAKMKGLSEATASVGVASFAGGQVKTQISFGSLMKDASDALKRAQAAGGDKVEATEPTKRDRISIG